jgi:hypothetical protein
VKRWLHKITLIGAVIAAVVAGAPAAAQADTPWTYTTDNSSASGAKFWTDPGGNATKEKLSVCDNQSNGLGVRAQVTWVGVVMIGAPTLQDSLDNGNCVSAEYDMFPEGVPVQLEVCHFYGHVYNTGDALFDCGYGVTYA